MSTLYEFRKLPGSLHALLDTKAAEAPDHVYAVCAGEPLTYGELARLSNVAASHLRSAGVRSGDHVMVMMDSCREYLAVWFALSRLGATEASINPAYKGPMLSVLVETADPKACIIATEYYAQVAQACPTIVDNVPVMQPGALVEDDGSITSAISEDFSDSKIAAIIFTSGTTGASKGVMMSHRHQLAFGQAFAEITELNSDDVTYNFLPFFHIAAKFLALGSMLRDSKMLLVPRFSLSSFWPDVKQHGVTVISAVGGLCHMLFSQPEKPDDADNPLRLIYAVPVPWEFKDAFEQRFELKLIEGYGGTECNLVAYSRISEVPPRGSIGRASPHFEIQIQDDEGYEQPVGEPGEICVRPKYPGTMMSGYLGLPDKTLETNLNYWFHTGDRGYMNAEGYVFFLDRVKDAIRRRGENISSFEVERVLNAHPDISESAVIPCPSEMAGEDEVKAIIVVKPGHSVSEEAIFLYAHDNMAYFMVPRFIEVRDSLPRTPTMKIKKAELRVEGNSENTWDCEEVGYRISGKGLKKPAKKAQLKP